jgi:DNA repair protein SbcC/Rad50
VTPPELENISITDFRSVRGTVSVPLGAEIVLLHGANGAGKSTVMSAIELALTGVVSDLDAEDRRHLVHRGTDLATIELASTGAANTLTLGLDGEVSGEALLTLEDSRFLAERCYLRQRTLGRLLELYEESASGGDSPLTVFVKDLLGLDELEALIDGLDPVGDLRRLRNAVPEYRQGEAELERENERLGELSDVLGDAEKRAAETRAQLADVLGMLDAPPTLLGEPEGVVAWLETQREQQSLVALVEARQELAGMQRRLSKLAPSRPDAIQMSPGAPRLLHVRQRTRGGSRPGLNSRRCSTSCGVTCRRFPPLPRRTRQKFMRRR